MKYFLEKNMSTEMEEAIKSGDLKQVHLLIENDPAALENKEYWKRQTPLALAISKQQIAVAEYLIEKGAITTTVGHFSPLIIATENQDIPMLEMLFNKIPNMAVNEQNPLGGDTVLHVAVKKDNTVLALYLIQKGISRNHFDEYGNAPIHCVKSIEMLDLLLKFGADINMPRSLSQHSAHKSYHKKTLLHLMVPPHMSSDMQFIDALIERGADLYSLDCEGNTPMHDAYESCNMAFILKYGKKYPELLTQKNNQGNTPLMALFYSGPYNLPENILDVFTLPYHFSETNNDGKTALHLAMNFLSFKNELISTLINFYAKTGDINKQDNQGNTALHLAFTFSRAELLVDELLKAGADMNIYNNEGNTPLQQYITKLYKPEDKEFSFILKVLPLINDLNHCNKKNETLLHMLSKIGCFQAVKYYLEKNPECDIDLLSNKDESAAFIALSYGHMDIFEYLVSKGASISLIKQKISKSEENDKDVKPAEQKLALCYPETDEQKRQAIEIAMTAIAFRRWSQKPYQYYDQYQASIAHLIENHGESNFIAACKQIFTRHLNSLDMKNIEECGPHSDMDPYPDEYMRVAKFILNCKYDLYMSMRYYGYYVNVKTLFGDRGFWRILQAQHPVVYQTLLQVVKEWPHEIDSKSLYFKCKFNPLIVFKKAFPQAFAFIESDLKKMGIEVLPETKYQIKDISFFRGPSNPFLDHIKFIDEQMKSTFASLSLRREANSN